MDFFVGILLGFLIGSLAGAVLGWMAGSRDQAALHRPPRHK